MTNEREKTITNALDKMNQSEIGWVLDSATEAFLARDKGDPPSILDLIENAIDLLHP